MNPITQCSKEYPPCRGPVSPTIRWVYLAQNKSPKPFSESFLMRSTIPYATIISICGLAKSSSTYVGHYIVTVGAFDISEWHFNAFVLVDTKFGVINVGDVIECDSMPLVLVQSRCIRSNLLLSCTMILVTRTAVSVVICFGPSRRPSKPFFLNSDVLSGHISERLRGQSIMFITSWRIVTCYLLVLESPHKML